MRILDQYIIKRLLIPILFCVFTLIFLIIIADLFDHLSDLIKNKTALTFIAQYYFYLIPFAFSQIIPWATFLGVIFLLVDFNTHNEILAMKVAGFSISKIILPMLYVGFLIGLIAFLVNDRYVPSTLRKAQTILEERIENMPANPDMPSNPVIENFTYFSLGNRLYYGKKFNLKTHSMEEGFIILFFDEKKRVRRKVFAKEGRWENNAWKLRNVTDYETGAEGKMLGEPRIYSEKVYEEITETPKEMAKSSNESALLSYRELKYYIQQMQENGLQSYRERVDLHYKLSSPWNSLIMMFIAILFLTVSRRKKVIALNVLYCLGLAFLFHVIGALSLAMGKAGTLPPFLSAWSNNLLFAIGSIFFLDRAND